MPTEKIIEYCLYGAAALVVLLVIIIIAVKAHKRKKIREEQKTREVEGVVEKNGVRYSEDATIVDKDGNQNVSLV